MFIFYYYFFTIFNVIYCLNLNEQSNNTIVGDNLNKSITVNNDNDTLIQKMVIPHLFAKMDENKNNSQRDVSFID